MVESWGLPIVRHSGEKLETRTRQMCSETEERTRGNCVKSVTGQTKLMSKWKICSFFESFVQYGILLNMEKQWIINNPCVYLYTVYVICILYLTKSCLIPFSRHYFNTFQNTVIQNLRLDETNNEVIPATISVITPHTFPLAAVLYKLLQS